ncbi:MAG: hypothetical protein QME52_08540, partial [Bacteroidota bacterium]|nr:hypothetical protein [Bacteroidota bacterium]
MIKNILLVYIIAFIFSSCEKIDPVEIIDEQDDSRFIELNAVSVSSDSLNALSGVDSSGLLEPDNIKYNARLVFTGLRYDFPLKRDSLIQVEAIFLDTSKTIQHNGRPIAYNSFDVGTLSLDSDTLQKHQRRIRLPSGDTLIGYRYQLRKTYSYLSGNEHHWRGTGSEAIGSFDTLFNLPLEMRVTDITPKYIRRAEPIRIKWNCANPIVHIIISQEGELQQKTWVPILHMK